MSDIIMALYNDLSFIFLNSSMDLVLYNILDFIINLFSYSIYFIIIYIIFVLIFYMLKFFIRGLKL